MKNSFAKPKSSFALAPQKDSAFQRRINWLRLSGAWYEMAFNSLYYYRLLEENRDIVNRFDDQIRIDLHRTFPHDPYFAEPESLEVLENILRAYSFRNPNVGYCQGMNFIAGRFLTLKFSEVESFWMMVQVVEQFLPFEYYSTMSGVLLDQKVFDYLLRTRLPKIAKVFDRIEMNTSLITVQWFTCMFAYTFKSVVVARLWDEIFLHGHYAIYKVALAVFDLSYDMIKDKNELTDIFEAIEKTCKAIKTPERLVEVMNRKLFRMHPLLLKRLQESANQEVMKELHSRCDLVYGQEEIMKKMLGCCENEDTCKQMDYATTSFFTFMTDVIISVDEDYLDVFNYEKQVDVSLIRESKNLMTGRKNHICRNVKESNEYKVFDNEVKSSFIQISDEVKGF